MKFESTTHDMANNGDPIEVGREIQTDRITVTFPVRNSAAEVIVFVAGPEKAPMLAKAFDPATKAASYPVQQVRPRNGI